MLYLAVYFNFVICLCSQQWICQWPEQHLKVQNIVTKQSNKRNNQNSKSKRQDY